MNFDEYPWLEDLDSDTAKAQIRIAREHFRKHGAFVFPNFLTEQALKQSAQDARASEDSAFTTDDTHTVYLKNAGDDPNYPIAPTFECDGNDVNNRKVSSIVNHEMRTRVASTAFDELAPDSTLANLYRNNPTLLKLVSEIVQKKLYLSEDPLGCCSINVFRPDYYHSFHFDESEFSTTLMLQEAEEGGLFQYTSPLRQNSSDLACSQVANAVHRYGDSSDEQQDDDNHRVLFAETTTTSDTGGNSVRIISAPELHTLDFHPGTLSIFSGSRSLHRVTPVRGNRSRLVAVLTFATESGFCNSAKVQKLFWGRSSSTAE